MIIGITGKAGAGKDTIADYLIKTHNYKKISLADPIRRIIQDVFVLSHEQVWDRVEREKPLPQWNNWTVRKLLQIIGTESMRNIIDDEIWVKHAWFTIKKQLEQNPDLNFVIPDIRFPNELEYFRRRIPARTYPTGETYAQFECWKVLRDGCDGNVGIKGHASEQYDLKADCLLYNGGTFEDLYEQIELCLQGG
jgi:hypothetical protein